ncbi:hypothetical protein VYU27_004906 [Nannochloropsis oceanica]
MFSKEALEVMAPAASVSTDEGRSRMGNEDQAAQQPAALIEDGVERTLCLVEPKPSNRQPQDKIPTLIKLTRRLISVGRSLKSEVILSQGQPQNTISRKHAEVLVTEDGTTHIQDVGSLNGIFINRVKIRRARLHSGDLVQFGGAAGLQEGAELGHVSNRAIVYRYLERGKGGEGGKAGCQTSSGAGSFKSRGAERGGGGGGGKGEERQGCGTESKRRRVSNGIAATAVTASGRGSSSIGTTTIKTMKQKAGAMRAISSNLREEQQQQLQLEQIEQQQAEIASLREALATARQEEGWVFAALNMAPSLGLRQAAAAVAAAVATEKKAREVEEEVKEERKRGEGWREALRAKDAELMAAEARADAAVAESRIKNEELKNQAVAAAAAATAVVEKEKAGEERRKEMEGEIIELRRARTSLQTQLDKLKAVRTTKTMEEGREGRGKAEVLAELEGELGCALCSELMVDAGVLPCSHAFCFSCIRAHFQQQPQQHRCCPVCREIVPASLPPYRSSNMDVVVAMVVEGWKEGGVKREEWVKRDRQTKKRYERWGGEKVVCYPHAPRLTVEEEEEERREASERKEQAKREREGGLSGKMRWANEKGEKGNSVKGSGGVEAFSGVHIPTNGAGKEGREDEEEEEEEEEEVWCEGCNEKGHDIGECPHVEVEQEDEEEEEEQDEEEVVEDQGEDDDSERGSGW